MMYFIEDHFGKLCLLAIAAFIVLIFWAVQDDNKFRDACEAKGGKVISTENNTYCVKKDFFVS